MSMQTTDTTDTGDGEQELWEQIADLISALSQATWAAGWLIDAEHHAWRWVQDRSTAPRVVHGHLDALAHLALSAGVWVRWDDRTRGPRPVRMDRWLARHDIWARTHVAAPAPLY